MSLPEVTEKLSHGAPSFFIRKQFVMLWPDGHHEHHFAHLWCAAPPGAQQELVDTEPERFFRPPYVGPRGWIGVRLDRKIDWPRSKPSAQTPIEPSPPRSWPPSSTPPTPDLVEEVRSQNAHRSRRNYALPLTVG